MRILYVVSRPLEINTSASIRNKATIEGLLELGHTVDIITTQYDTNHSNYDSSLSNEKVNVKYIQLGGVQNLARMGRRLKFLKPIKNLGYQVLSRMEIYDNLKTIVNHVNKMEIKDGMYDIVISSSDPKSSHLFVSELFRNKVLSNTPWIQIWGDPFLSDITRKNRLMGSRVKKEEDRLLKQADRVVYVSNLTLKSQQETYSHYKEKMIYAPIPYLKKEIYPQPINRGDTLTLLYCGDYSTNVRDIREIYRAVKSTNHNLIICGQSDIKLEPTERIKIYPRVSYSKIKELEAESDVLVHLSNLKGTQIPGKIYQYSGTNKPILFILDGKSDILLQTFSGYGRYVFTKNNEIDISNAITNIKNGKYEDCNFVVEEFSPRLIANRIIEESKLFV